MAEGWWEQGSGERYGAQRKKSLVEDLSLLTTGSLATATTCIRGILQPLEQQPCLVPPSPDGQGWGKDTEDRETDLDLGRESHPGTLPQP